MKHLKGSTTQLVYCSLFQRMVWSLLPTITNTASVISTQGHSFLGRLHFGSKILFLDFCERMTTTNLLHWAAHFRIQSAYGGCLTACPYQLHWCRSQGKFGGGERIGRWVWFPIWPTPEGPENFSRASCSESITSAGSPAALSDTQLLFGHLKSPSTDLPWVVLIYWHPLVVWYREVPSTQKPPLYHRVSKHQRENQSLPKELTCNSHLNLVGFVSLLQGQGSTPHLPHHYQWEHRLRAQGDRQCHWWDAMSFVCAQAAVSRMSEKLFELSLTAWHAELSCPSPGASSLATAAPSKPAPKEKRSIANSHHC